MLDLVFIVSHIVQMCRNQRARPVIIDPGLYHSMKSGVFRAKARRSIPASFKLYTVTTPLQLSIAYVVLRWLSCAG